MWGQMWQQGIKVDKREKMLISQSTGLTHLLFLPTPRTAEFLPRQKHPEASCGIHSSFLPKWATISGLGPKSPVCEGKKMDHSCSY